MRSKLVKEAIMSRGLSVRQRQWKKWKICGK